jgi:quercetin dioxygenase-like cupin family protein
MSQNKTTATPTSARTGHEGLAKSLTAAIIDFDLPTELAQLRQEEAWSKSGRNSKTLAKYADFRIVLVALKAGLALERHKAGARISIQALAGRLRVKLSNRTMELPAGHLLALDRGLEHDVEAIEDGAFLLTISWPKDSET